MRNDAEFSFLPIVAVSLRSGSQVLLLDDLELGNGTVNQHPFWYHIDPIDSDVYLLYYNVQNSTIGECNSLQIKSQNIIMCTVSELNMDKKCVGNKFNATIILRRLSIETQKMAGNTKVFRLILFTLVSNNFLQCVLTNFCLSLHILNFYPQDLNGTDFTLRSGDGQNSQLALENVVAWEAFNSFLL